MSLEQLYEYSFTPTDRDLEYFKNIFLAFKSDKTLPHTYHNIYSALFQDKDSVTDIIEMGIAGGGSLRALTHIFKNANVTGMDINGMLFFSEDRIKCMYADQMDSQSIRDVREKLGNIEFDLIIDDGSHYLLETVNTFETMLPWLKVNGWFVVEDIKNEFLDQWNIIANKMSEQYERFLINMNEGVHDLESGLQMSDNTVLVVHRKW